MAETRHFSSLVGALFAEVMPKAEKGSAKAIANSWKSKGLTKLKFYCPICQKGCRDANGFKCHSESESHLK